MPAYRLKTSFWICAFLSLTTINGFAAEASPSLLDITDRGSITNTPYTIANHSVLLESGYQYGQLTPTGSLKNYPQSVLFFGLPANSELMATLPAYIQALPEHSSGFNAPKLGIKHELIEGEKWITGIETQATFPSGSDSFGSHGLGMELTGLASYHFLSNFFLSSMIGVTTVTEPFNDGGRRFNSINASAALTLGATEKLTVFAELFGQSKTNASQGGNYNADCGVLYLLTPHVVLDTEIGLQLSHEPGVFKNFINSGISILF